MTVVLVSPPFLDPRAPYLALPSLTAYLRERGRRVVQTDLNVRCLDAMLSADYLRELFGDRRPEALAFCLERIDEAVASLRDPRAFLDYPTYLRSRNTLDLALRCISSLYPGEELNLRRIASAGGTVRELATAVLGGWKSPFEPFYRELFVPEILAESPTVVGISVSNGSQLRPALILSHLLRRQGARTVLGGPVVTRARAEIAEAPELFEITDGCVLYEGEEALERLVDNLEAGREPYSGVRNCICPEGGEIVTRNVPFALDLATLPTPDFEGLPLAAYFAPRPVLPLLSAKGCAWGLCTFCTIPDTSSSAGLRSRERPTDRVVEDVATLKRRFGAEHFVFVDEDISARRLENLSRALIDARLDVLWLGYSRFERGHTRERCGLYREAGCRKLLMGLESASTRILRLMRKGITARTVDRNLEALDAADVSVNVFCMLGFPSETRAEMDGTMAFLRDRRHLLFRRGFSACFGEFVLDTDSDVDREPEKFGLIKGERYNDWKFVGEPAGDDPPELRDLATLRRRFNAELRDLFYPDEMIGWEEYTLLYEDAPEPCRLPWRRPARELADRVHGPDAAALVFRRRPFRAVQAVLGYRPSGPSPWWLIHGETAYALQVADAAVRLLGEIDGDADLETVLGRFAWSLRQEASAIRPQCLDLVEELWKHGFLELAPISAFEDAVPVAQGEGVAGPAPESVA